MSRLEKGQNQEFDVIIIGGGIIGCGIARDAAMRGLNAALFEQNDFGSGTTAGSTRLIHGGLRYLEQLDFKLVKMDLQERAILLKIAPHLVKPLPFILPFYETNFFTRTKFKIGLSLYDFFAGKDNLEKHQTLTTKEIASLEPNLSTENLHGGALFYDAQCNLPERLCLENALDAEMLGAQIFNYARVVDAIRENNAIKGVVVEDRFKPGQAVNIYGKIVINASGAWFNQVAGIIEKENTHKIRLTKGIHLACPPSLKKRSVIFNSPIDGRAMFVIPWLDYTWIGTTDTDYQGDPKNAKASQEDVQYLIESAKKIIPSLKSDEVYFSTAGIRALVRAKGSESSVSRMHKIENPKSGLINVLGGKITGYRAISEEVVDYICQLFGNSSECKTAETPLPGAKGRIEIDSFDSLAEIYGFRVHEILEMIEKDKSLAQPIHENYPEIKAQVKFAVEKEHCRTAKDFIFRRTKLGFSVDQGKSAFRIVNRLIEMSSTELK
jgi:glycerol-3-phosphate dehydrogenase